MGLIVTRDITPEECPWLDEVVEKGTKVFKYYGCTYGCVQSSGTAVTLDEGVTPFFEVPSNAIEVSP